MASTLKVLSSIMPAAGKSQGEVMVLGLPYLVTDPLLGEFVNALKDSDDFQEDWPLLKLALRKGLVDARGPLADARLLALFSHYLVAVRSSVQEGEPLPTWMFTWLGKGANRIPAENSVWFLLETEEIGSEAARDVINVLGGETTFLGHFFDDKSDEEVVEQAGIYLAMLLHLRQKWPDYYQWMQMEGRMHNMRELFLMGSEELQVSIKSSGKEIVILPIIEVYRMLSITMYQTKFFLLLREYAAELRLHKGFLSDKAIAIRSAMLAD